MSGGGSTKGTVRAGRIERVWLQEVLDDNQPGALAVSSRVGQQSKEDPCVEKSTPDSERCGAADVVAPSTKRQAAN